MDVDREDARAAAELRRLDAETEKLRVETEKLDAEARRLHHGIIMDAMKAGLALFGAGIAALTLAESLGWL